MGRERTGREGKRGGTFFFSYDKHSIHPRHRGACRPPNSTPCPRLHEGASTARYRALGGDQEGRREGRRENWSVAFDFFKRKKKKKPAHRIDCRLSLISLFRSRSRQRQVDDLFRSFQPRPRDDGRRLVASEARAKKNKKVERPFPVSTSCVRCRHLRRRRRRSFSPAAFARRGEKNVGGGERRRRGSRATREFSNKKLKRKTRLSLSLS